MEPALGVALLWLVFGTLHVGLASEPIRGALVKRYGEWRFTLVFSLIAATSFGLLLSYYSTHRASGAPGLALGQVEALRWAGMGMIGLGMSLMGGSLAAYPRSPMALFGASVRAPYGLERITRHPFFVGVTLLAIPHVLLAHHLVGAVLVAGFIFLSVVGARHQDKKLLKLRGEPYARYLATTSAVPFAAVLAGRQQIAWRELPFGGLAVGLALTFLLRAVHDGIFAHGGAWAIGVIVVGVGFLTWQTWRRSRRAGPTGASTRAQEG